MKRKTAVLALFCLPAILFMGCSDLRAEDTATSTAAYAEEGGFDYGTTEESAVADAAGNETGTAVYADGQAADDRKIIRTASMTLEARDYEEALAALRAAVDEAGGYIEYTASYADSGARSAEFTCRVPAAQYAPFLEAVQAAGSVLHSEESTQDATGEYVDIEARLNSLRTQEARLLALMEESGSLEELLAVQEKLTEVQYEIERYTGQQKALENSIDYASVFVYVQEVEAYTPAEPDFGARVAAAFSGMLQGVVDGAQGFVIALIYALPFLAVGGAATVVIVLCVRRRRRNRPPVQPPVPPQENRQ